MKLKITLLISTYNWPDALRLVFKSLQNQSVYPDEVLIADDGSTDETRELIRRFKEKSTIPFHHYWHEDDGFRKATILNKAIAGSNGDYIIQVDGDCILHKHFVKDHISDIKKNTYLYGSRVTIVKNHLDELFSKENINFHVFSKGIKKRTRTLRIPMLSKLYTDHAGLSSKFRGCNVSFWKKDILAVNGYDEDFTGWGREDSELILRMINNGISGKRLRYKGIVYHIWHEIKSKHNLKKNDEMQTSTLLNEKKRCDNGIDKYL